MNAIEPVLALLSVVLLTGAAAALRRTLVPVLCPLCAGVAGTWLGLLALPALGVAVDPLITAVLMGGSVVGAAYVLERRHHGQSGAPLWWKTAFVVAGFAAAYALLHHAWLAAAIGVGTCAVLAALAGRGTARAPETGVGHVDALTEQMKNCC